MATTLHLQNPGGPGSTLAAELLRLAAQASGGGGIFAWTTIAGIADVLEDAGFKAFVAVHPFELVVGTDSITNPAALARLDTLRSALPNLRVDAFWHDQAALFHPKFAWFEIAGALSLVMGSGNLTGGGLSGNWEFFTVAELDPRESQKVRMQIADWRASHASYLLPLNDVRVLERVKRNRLEERTILRSRKAVEAATAARATAAAGTVEVLVAEPTYAAGRAGQANFHKSVFEGFFRALANVPSRHDFYEVDAVGGVGSRETLAAITVGSHNYRFELPPPVGSSLASPPYPIGVFLRLETDEILYQLLRPTDAGYASMEQLLQQKSGRSAGSSRRQEVMSVADLQAAWPNAPLLTAKPPPP